MGQRVQEGVVVSEGESLFTFDVLRLWESVHRCSQTRGNEGREMKGDGKREKRWKPPPQLPSHSLSLALSLSYTLRVIVRLSSKTNLCALR